ncbi:hypothetical protein [Ruegeria aquimaris]|uniref:Response regulatory domain-containing protein n=1 Tax=Ruegeria aquimaris TaxID=2984333 RepID=A0ABT3ARX9_9RHOB|nr:hypothetical protein [Ruegeria sp. XHP0148]MCV2891332.1 hypothetical protein [Ruegeria sp. XHP0148]
MAYESHHGGHGLSLALTSFYERLKAWLHRISVPGSSDSKVDWEHCSIDVHSDTKEAWQPRKELLNFALDEIGPGLLLGQGALVVGPSWRSSGHLAGWLEDLGAEVQTSKGIDQALHILERQGDMCGLLVVMLDGNCDDEFFDLLSLVRLKYSDIPVVLLSRVFETHDYSAVRNPICDVALRIPLGRIAFELGVLQAISGPSQRRLV